MMSLNELRAILQRPDLSDADAEDIRGDLYWLARTLIKKFLDEKKQKPKKGPEWDTRDDRWGEVE